MIQFRYNFTQHGAEAGAGKVKVLIAMLLKMFTIWSVAPRLAGCSSSISLVSESDLGNNSLGFIVSDCILAWSHIYLELNFSRSDAQRVQVCEGRCDGAHHHPSNIIASKNRVKCHVVVMPQRSRRLLH